jgi:hypothetical protein
VEKIALMTDGFADSTESLTRLGEIIKEQGLKKTYDDFSDLLDNDPDFERIPRLKDKDDATALLVDVHNSATYV